MNVAVELIACKIIHATIPPLVVIVLLQCFPFVVISINNKFLLITAGRDISMHQSHKANQSLLATNVVAIKLPKMLYDMTSPGSESDLPSLLAVPLLLSKYSDPYAAKAEAWVGLLGNTHMSAIGPHYDVVDLASLHDGNYSSTFNLQASRFVGCKSAAEFQDFKQLFNISLYNCRSHLHYTDQEGGLGGIPALLYNLTPRSAETASLPQGDDPVQTAIVIVPTTLSLATDRAFFSLTRARVASQTPFGILVLQSKTLFFISTVGIVTNITTCYSDTNETNFYHQAHSESFHNRNRIRLTSFPPNITHFSFNFNSASIAGATIAVRCIVGNLRETLMGLVLFQDNTGYIEGCLMALMATD